MEEQEKKQDERFAFGKNWQSYLEHLDDSRINRAVKSIQEMLGVETLKGKNFLDIGSGSGLFSLSAHILGAEVTSFDYDADSVAAIKNIKQQYAPKAENWTIMQGDVLDEAFIKSFGTYDIVYSWGVLHHTGDMWQALENATARVAENGLFFISIYNDQGDASRRWKAVKKFYNRSPKWMQALLIWLVTAYFEGRHALARIISFKNPIPNIKKRNAEQPRGMSFWYDYIDWVGGYPFEVAKPEEIFEFCRKKVLYWKNLKHVVVDSVVTNMCFLNLNLKKCRP